MRIVLLGLLIMTLFACSQTDDSSPKVNPSETLQGIFIDSTVEGLRYETETHSGYTDENGQFDYEEGEMVTFYVGDIKLGTTPAAEEISPISIASTPDADINTLEVQNIAAFLQTLDEDGDPSNGIKITQEVSQAISLSEIDFSNSIVQILGEIALEVFQNTGINLEVVYPEVAAAHLAQTLDLEFEPQDLFMKNFVPVFSDYYGHNSKISQWVHEFDENGRLTISTKFEKYPLRVLAEFNFSDYTNTTVEVKITDYRYDRVLSPYEKDFRIYFDEFFMIKKLENLSTGYNPTLFILISEINSNGFIQKTETLDQNGELNSFKEYQYDSDIYLIKTFSYDSDNDLTNETDFTYTDFGDLKTEFSLNQDNSSFYREYFYRNNNTLEKLEWRTHFESFDAFITMEYDENEALLKDVTITNHADGQTQKTIEIYDSGIPVSFEWILNGVKKQFSLYKLDSNGDSYIYKNEQYDENGNLEYTEYFDENGNLINTEYT